MSKQLNLKSEVPEHLSGKRLDQIAAQLFPEYSRARLQNWIKQGSLRVNSLQLRARDKLQTGDTIELVTELEAEETWIAEDLPLNIMFEDEHLIVLNKATDMVVHPAAGHRQGTVLNGLLHHCPELKEVPRAGIVHRLDKDTTGLMVVAKTIESHLSLVKQLQDRTVTREYQAVVHGVLTGGGRLDFPLGRHPVNRKKRTVVPTEGQEAITHFWVMQRFRSYTHVRVRLETGRTHQIRIHMAHSKHPLVGDPLYGGRLRLPAACSAELADELKNFKRQALHAAKLALQHPASNEEMEWETELPADMLQLLKALKEDA